MLELLRFNKFGNSKHSINRLDYYTEMTFKICNKVYTVFPKIDTGSAHTVIGLEAIGVVDSLSYVISKLRYTEYYGYAITGNVVNFLECVVDDLSLSGSPVFPKTRLFFSKDIEDKIVLGNDLFGLFDHKYIKDVHSRNGTYYLLNPEADIKKVEDWVRGSAYDYFAPNVYSLESAFSYNKQSRSNFDYTDQIHVF